MLFNDRIKHIYFIGIGGSGMLGLAKILLYKGYQISGSDIIITNSIRYLIKLGARVFDKHHSDNIYGSDLVIISSAINSYNPEILAAKKMCIPIIKRGEMLSELIRYNYGIAITGTHGKTTTTGMITSIFVEARLDPTFINGGIIKNVNTFAKLGFSKYCIVEADESDASFLFLQPIVGVITNIEADHMDTYQSNFDNLIKTYIDFLNNLSPHGYIVACIDDPVICKLLPQVNREIITYGSSNLADFRIIQYFQLGHISVFYLYSSQYYLQLRVFLNIPGYHNALNATAAIAVARKEGIDDQIILKALFHFKGINRRFEILGCYKLQNINGKYGTIMLIDDYGHHPTEIDMTIKSIRFGWPTKRLVMIFQPHRFTRTRDLYNDFVFVLSNVDLLFILDIYPAGETPILDITSSMLCNSIRDLGKIDPILVLDIKNFSHILFLMLQDNDVILIQGAGTVGMIVRSIILV